MSSSSSLQRSADLAEPTSKATSLLDLPDELLVDIFQAVYDLRADVSWCRRTVPPIYSCKRIYNVSLPIWRRRVELWVPDTPADVTELCDRVRARTLVRQCVQHLIFKQFYDLASRTDDDRLPPEIAGVLLLFPGLRSLGILPDDHPDNWDFGLAVPAPVTNALSALRSLHELSLGINVYFEDEDFDLRTTSIRVLRLNLSDYPMLRHGRGANLDTLTIDSHTPAGCDVPWRTLRTLRLRGEPCHAIDDAAAVLPSLAAAVLDGPLPLSTFELGIDDLDPPPHQLDLDVRRSEQYRALYTILQLAQPRFVKVTNVEFCPPRPPRGVGSFPTVVELELEANMKLLDLSGTTFAGLVAFLHLFPSMTDFYLSDCIGTDQSVTLVADYIDLSPAAFSARHPGFAGLVVILEVTLVLKFEFWPWPELLFLRGTRNTASDGFVFEAWQVSTSWS